ncbi:MAG: glycerol-3-phosphate 1-O-acyltransferase PlsY [Erysipelotrichales bacterium]|nr:glycerol-3-phosphate 1-O-acyltransferase PlsY [Erysipelotrichales bacterium]
MDYFIYFLLILMSYLYGSIPFALVIGKLFYHTDIRNQGSGNLGGTNAGRVLGKTAGVVVIILDASKCSLSIFIARIIAESFSLDPNIIYLCAMACVIGHCYPIFAGFKGGKAVSVAIGYALMVNFWAGIGGLTIFFITLKITKYVSLSSVLGSGSVLLASPWLGLPPIGILANVVIIGLLIYKHKENLIRIKEGTERKITWM